MHKVRKILFILPCLLLLFGCSKNTEKAKTTIINNKTNDVTTTKKNTTKKKERYAVNVSINISGAGTVTGAGFYDENQEATLTVTVNSGYNFVGFFEDEKLISKSLNYNFIITKTIELTAKFEAVSPDDCTVTFDSDGGSLVDSKTIAKGETVDEPDEPKKEGHTFDGWYYGDTKWVFAYSVTESITLKAKWTINSYTVTLNRNDTRGGTVSGSGTILYNTNVTITASTNTGYTFDGWYLNNEKVTPDSSYTFTMPSNNVVFEARWTPKKYTITLVNKANGVTITGITSGNKYDYNSSITLNAENIPSGYTIKWSRSDGITKDGIQQYSFTVPSQNITITITILPYERNGNKIYFGYYPQTLVTNTPMNNFLNVTAGTPSNPGTGCTWVDYGYYSDGSVSSYMWYIDIDSDDDGRYDYRGVYFTSYRLMLTSNTTDSYQDDNGYSTKTRYWFEYKPIEWDILKTDSGKAMLIANLILDSQDYYPVFGESNSFSHNGKTGYANNYELSSIRKWLNNNFYNTAFNDLEKAMIQSTTVDNSVASTSLDSNSYVCSNTNDKVFLLSNKEIVTYYSSTSVRLAIATDYAKAQGVYVGSDGYSSWRLRSPNPNTAYYAYYVGADGAFYSNYVGLTSVGVRPVLWIAL